MTSDTQALSQAAGRARKRTGTSYWGLVWQRLRNDRLTVFCLVIVSLLILTAVLAPLVAPYHFNDLSPLETRQWPSFRHLAGTDELGRDILSRLIYSLRNALMVAFAASFSCVALGCVIGAIAGYRGGVVDTILVGIIDITYSFPGLLFNIILVTVLGRGIGTIIIAIAATSWAGVARLMRAQVLSVKNRDFVLAARALGASGWRILMHYIIPNALGPLIVSVTFMIPSAMLQEGGLAVLGLGIPPPMPSWGTLINTGSINMRAFPYQLYIPAGSFALVLLAFTYLGDGVNRAINPRD